jgi:hypothetical protein
MIGCQLGRSMVRPYKEIEGRMAKRILVLPGAAEFERN